MNILELDSYNLADAVKFNDQLNPRIWQGQNMRPEVREKLLEIAADFKEFLGLSDLEVKDITVSGSNAAYTYTPQSDIDLHLVVDIPRADSDEVYRELFDAKKYQYNDMHNIKIGGYDVELYVENANKPPVSQGVFSVMNNDWINIPRQRKATVDDDAVRSKYEDIKHRIDAAIDSNDIEKVNTLAKKIKAYRQAGLDKHGELGPENLAYKMLRNQGYIEKLYKARAEAKDRELSLNERKKKKKRVKYGFARTWGPVYDFGDGGEGGDGGMAEDVSNTPDGVSPSTKMFLSEKDMPTHEEIIRDFLNFAVEKLDIETVPKLRLKKDPAWSIRNKSFGRYDNATGELIVALGNRHIMDILRTLAHELTHRKQDEREDMPPNAGETGSPYENEAHARAGMLMRDYAAMHPEYFEDVAVNESSGYIPTRAQAQDPRFKMALTVDVHPGQTGREANKMALKTDKQGKPALLIKSANLIGEAVNPRSHGYNSIPMSQVPGKQEDDLGNQEATGPEFEPQMPAGTTKVEVGDLTDWYRLGMDISDMDDADPADYNQGPPQTVIVFPSDEAEQGYLKQFKRLGLKTHDLDPDVEGGEDVKGKHLHKALAEELQAFKEQDLFEIKMTGKNLAKLAKDIGDVKVGLEFEMIVPNATVSGDEDMEPDYDQDDRVRDIDDCVNFFDDGDYNGSGTIRRLRDQMYEDYYTWRSEQVDNDWYNGGDSFEYFKDYLDREEPFDEEEAEEEARNQLQAEYGDELDTEEFEKMLFALVDEKRESYAQEQWDDQGRNFDDAREEYTEERADDYSEQDWLESQGIRYASDVESNYSGDITWPYYTSNSGDGEADIERIALEFMNDSGLPYDSVAVSSSYHGTYKKWVGNGWVSVGSNKPDDCFSIEPDGSLDGNSSDDVGLEFVSPPIPLDQVESVMQKVQQWAAQNGVYTGKSNKTSMHTNISVPGYDLKNLDYLKAALLLGDEYVLREFDRIGNSYAKPAIEKIRQLVNQKPEKAKELLDKMKSQLNAAASKLIHSGVTDKFTSINTKDNRIEFRSPGGDYLSDIADNPQKMTNMINRMVVAMDAAMDPNKYKEEYQKKLYKMLTGQTFGREAKSGLKQEPKKDTNDLLNLFSRYAAGELPKAALKSFVRQAQLERKGKKADAALASHNWAIRRRDGGDIVRTFQADNYMQAFDILQQYKQKHNITDDSLTYGPYKPSEEKPAQQGVPGLYRIYTTSGGLIAGDTYGSDAAALERAQHWAQRRGEEVVVRNEQGQEIGRVSPSGDSTPVPGSTLDLQRQRAAQSDEEPPRYEMYRVSDGRTVEANGMPIQFVALTPEDAERKLRIYAAAHNLGAPELFAVRSVLQVPQAQPAQAQQNQGNWGIWIIGNNRFANQPGTYARGADVPLYRFPSQEAAESWLAQQRAERAGLRTDIEVREIEPTRTSVGDINLFPEIEPSQQTTGETEYIIFNMNDRSQLTGFRAANQAEAEREAESILRDLNLDPDQYDVRERNARPIGSQQDNWSQDFERRMQQGDAAQGGIVDVAGSEVGQTYNPTGTGSFTGQWLVLDPNNRVIYRFGGVGNSQSDANRIAMAWLQQNPRQMVDGVTVAPEMG